MDFIMTMLLLILLSLAVYHDLKFRKVPNKITVPMALAGILLSVLHSGLEGLVFSIVGHVFGLLIFIIPYMMGGMGAGDVKLMASIGALMGWRFTMWTALGAALAGGLMVVLYMTYKKELGNTLLKAVGILLIPLGKRIYEKTFSPKILKMVSYFENKQSRSSAVYIPYAVAIATGSILVLFGAFVNF
ncbi:prepilin peptidase [Proteiniclasticum sp. SCR006]|uniref:Prepilin peptidase n=1 Tax=Proteiniclasticum aestuarii TaxID=2817862 RepID=A0A939HDI0_9CLOT|nr:A24 family peptidase [Proteiniclasticum aestuarii]MBO1265987.1 prepilin peptidase [Proteiniclasticum aestuarii]